MRIRRTEWLKQKDKERFEDTKDVNRRTENTMVKRKRTKGQRMTCKTLHRNQVNRTGWFVITTNGTYPWSFVRQIFCNS
jgi:hypothetical protein